MVPRVIALVAMVLRSTSPNENSISLLSSEELPFPWSSHRSSSRLTFFTQILNDVVVEVLTAGCSLERSEASEFFATMVIELELVSPQAERANEPIRTLRMRTELLNIGHCSFLKKYERSDFQNQPDVGGY